MRIRKYKKADLIELEIKITRSLKKDKIKYLWGYSKNILNMFSSEKDYENLKFSFSEETELKFYNGEFSLWNDYMYPKLNDFIIDLIKTKPEYFVKDIYLKEMAMYYRGLNDILNMKSEELFTYIVNNKVSNIMRVYDFYHKGINTPNFIYLLDKRYLVETLLSNKTIGKQYYLKDIFAILFKKIKEKKMKIEDINLETFFEEKEKELHLSTQKYLLSAKEIIESGFYYRERKKIDYKRLNQKTFINFFSTFAKTRLISRKNPYLNFFTLMKKHKIINNDLRPEFLIDGDFKKTIYNYSLYAKCKLPSKKVTKLPINSYMLYFKNTEEYLIKLKQYQKNNKIECISGRILNPKKYTYKTKQILKEKLLSIEGISNNAEIDYENVKIENSKELLNFILKIIDNLKQLGVSEKTIRGFITKYIDFKNFTEVIDTTLRIDRELVHNTFEVTLYSLDILLKTLVNHSFNNSKMINFFISELSTFNIENISLDKITGYIEHFGFYQAELNKEKAFRNIIEFNLFISLKRKEKNEDFLVEIKEKMKIDKNDYSFLLSSKMNKMEEYIILLRNIYDDYRNLYNYHKKPYFKKIEKKSEKYTVGLLPHNDSIGLLSANVSGVCITSYGQHRVSQVTPNFINLSIYNDDKIMLWGLLCRAINEKGEIYYILNNLQGRINNNINKKEVLSDIHFVFEKLIKTKKIKNILYLNHGFNSIILNSEYKVNTDIKKIKCIERIRLDFDIDNDNTILGTFNSFVKE